MLKKTKRDIVEETLLERFSQIRPYTPEAGGVVDNYKDGGFGVSNIGFALYSNGYNLRGKSSNYPYGLLFEDGETLFSIGYFRKELDPSDSDGYLFIVAPRGKRVIEKIIGFTNAIMSNDDLPCKGVYVRFMTLDQYVGLLNAGFLPVKESPWHDDSPEEDETLTNSLLRLDDIITLDEKGEILEVKTLEYGSRRSKKRFRLRYNRFRNFLERNDLKYTLIPYKRDNFEVAKDIIKNHFKIIREKGEPVGSTAEDYYGLINPELIGLNGVIGYLGYIGTVPVSIFVGEMVSDKRFALYTALTLHSAGYVLPMIGIDTDNEEIAQGFTALCGGAYLEVCKELKKQGIEEVLFGGSEHIDLNKIKRHLGCRNDPTYWAVWLK